MLFFCFGSTQHKLATYRNDRLWFFNIFVWLLFVEGFYATKQSKDSNLHCLASAPGFDGHSSRFHTAISPAVRNQCHVIPWPTNLWCRLGRLFSRIAGDLMDIVGAPSRSLKHSFGCDSILRVSCRSMPFLTFWSYGLWTKTADYSYSSFYFTPNPTLCANSIIEKAWIFAMPTFFQKHPPHPSTGLQGLQIINSTGAALDPSIENFLLFPPDPRDVKDMFGVEFWMAGLDDNRIIHISFTFIQWILLFISLFMSISSFFFLEFLRDG